jgi:hypothetical protein
MSWARVKYRAFVVDELRMEWVVPGGFQTVIAALRAANRMRAPGGRRVVALRAEPCPACVTCGMYPATCGDVCTCCADPSYVGRKDYERARARIREQEKLSQALRLNHPYYPKR